MTPGDDIRGGSSVRGQALSMAASVAGGVIAFYQLGYGVAAFGAGPLQSAGVALSTIFGLTAAVALALGLLSFLVARAEHPVHHLHPRPHSTFAE